MAMFKIKSSSLIAFYKKRKSQRDCLDRSDLFALRSKPKRKLKQSTTLPHLFQRPYKDLQI